MAKRVFIITIFLPNNFYWFSFRDRLSASDMINVRKVIEHVYEKVLGQGSDAGSQAANSNSHEKEAEKEEEPVSSAAAEERVELLCNDSVRGKSVLIQFFFSSFFSLLELPR